MSAEVLVDAPAVVGEAGIAVESEVAAADVAGFAAVLALAVDSV